VPWEKITLQLSLGKSCGKDQRMKPLMVLVLSSVVLLGGCTTAYQPPPGLVWGYTGTSDAISSLRMVVYAQAKSDCEVSRAQQIYDAPKTNTMGKDDV